MLVQKINTHIKDGLGRLLEQYKGKPNIVALLTTLITQIQALEDGIFPIDQLRQLSSAFGAQLDGIGQLVGLSRNGLTDQQYLIFILGEIAKNNSDTTSNTLLNIVQTLFQTQEVFQFSPNSNGGGDGGYVKPASLGFGVSNPGTDPSLFTVVEQTIIEAIGAGIGLAFIIKFDAQHAFSFAGPQAWVAGFSDLNNPQPTDGQFASLLFNNNSQ